MVISVRQSQFAPLLKKMSVFDQTDRIPLEFFENDGRPSWGASLMVYVKLNQEILDSFHLHTEVGIWLNHCCWRLLMTFCIPSADDNIVLSILLTKVFLQHDRSEWKTESNNDMQLASGRNGPWCLGLRWESWGRDSRECHPYAASDATSYPPRRASRWAWQWWEYVRHNHGRPRQEAGSRSRLQHRHSSEWSLHFGHCMSCHFFASLCLSTVVVFALLVDKWWYLEKWFANFLAETTS